MNPLFKLLTFKFKKIGDPEDQKIIQDNWLVLATIYKKRQVELMPIEEDEKKKIDFQEKAQAFINKELLALESEQDRTKMIEKIKTFKSDVPELLNFCVMYYTQMHK